MGFHFFADRLQILLVDVKLLHYGRNSCFVIHLINTDQGSKHLIDSQKLQQKKEKKSADIPIKKARSNGELDQIAPPSQCVTRRIRRTGAKQY